MSKSVAFFISICLLCTLTSTGLAKSTTALNNVPDKKEDPKYETRVFIRRKCLLDPRPVKPKPGLEIVGALLAIFIPVLIEKAIGGVAGALKKAGDPDLLKDSGRLPTYLYRLPRVEPKAAGSLAKNEPKQTADPAAKNEPEKPILNLNPDFGCVLVVRGTFARPNEQIPKNPNSEEEARLNKLRASNILVREIAAVYEAEIILSEDETALRYEIRFLEVNQFQDLGQDKRAMVVNIAITGAGEKEGEPVLSLVMINLGEVRRGTVLKSADLESKQTSWVGGLGISEASLKAIEAYKFPPPNDPKDDEYKRFLEVMPVTIEGGFTETDKGNKALRFIGEVLESTKGEVSKTLSSEILKDRSKQAAEAANAKEKLLQEEEAAYSAYLEARAAREKADPTKPKEVEAKDFEVARTLRSWCIKFGTLEKLNIAPTVPNRPVSQCQ